MMASSALPTALILSGGLGLGAYHAGVARTVLESGRFDLRAVAGSSIGAVTAALIGGSAPERRVETLMSFWDAVSSDTGLTMLDPLGLTDDGVPRHVANWGSAASARLAGVPNLLRPRLPGERAPDQPRPSLYASEPMRHLLTRLLDFDRLNDGDLRVCICACDIERGQAVRWDTGRGDRIGLDHVLASGALLPAFSPVEIDGRLLGDGGFAMNAPLEPFLASDRHDADWPIAIVSDLFAREQPLPDRLEACIARSTDLQYAMQTKMRLDGLVRERGLEAQLTPELPGTDLFLLSYRPLLHEAGSEKTYDFSRRTLGDRNAVGAADAGLMIDMLKATSASCGSGLRVHEVPNSNRC